MELGRAKKDEDSSFLQPMFAAQFVALFTTSCDCAPRPRRTSTSVEMQKVFRVPQHFDTMWLRHFYGWFCASCAVGGRTASHATLPSEYKNTNVELFRGRGRTSVAEPAAAAAAPVEQPAFQHPAVKPTR